MILIPFVGMVISWPCSNNPPLSPFWFNTLSTLILSIVCICLSCYQGGINSLFHLGIIVTVIYAFCWHVLLFLLETGADVRAVCETRDTFDGLMRIRCYWPNPLWGTLLRDGAYFIIVICSIVSLRFSHQSCSLNSTPLAERLPDPVLQLNLLRPRTSVEQRRRRQRRSPFVIHYVLLRTGHIRRRRRSHYNQ